MNSRTFSLRAPGDGDWKRISRWDRTAPSSWEASSSPTCTGLPTVALSWATGCGHFPVGRAGHIERQKAPIKGPSIS